MADVDLSNQSILLADDVLFARVTVKKILSSFARPTVIEATHGEEALSLIEGKGPPISMIIADFNMPVMNGLELLKAIRCGQTPLPREFPIAMLTGYSDEHLVDMALALDVNAFLIKPISRDTMGARLNKMLDMAADSAWLQDVEVYDAVKIQTSEAAKLPAPKPKDNVPPIVKPPLVRAPKPKSRLSGTFTDEELAKPQVQPPVSSGPVETRAEALAQSRNEGGEQATREVMGRLSSLVGRMDNANSAKEVALGFQRMVSNGESHAAKQLVGVLDMFEKRGVISSDDISRVFSEGHVSNSSERSAAEAPTKEATERAPREEFKSLDDLSAGSVLARPLHTGDGSILFEHGTPLTSHVISILKKLDDLDLLLLEAVTEDAEANRGVFVRSADKPKVSSVGAQAKHVSNVPAGSVLARDIYLADGRIYMTAGTTMSPRLLSLLEDLIEMDRFDGQVWIAAN